MLGAASAALAGARMGADGGCHIRSKMKNYQNVLSRERSSYESLEDQLQNAQRYRERYPSEYRSDSDECSRERERDAMKLLRKHGKDYDTVCDRLQEFDSHPKFHPNRAWHRLTTDQYSSNRRTEEHSSMCVRLAEGRKDHDRNVAARNEFKDRKESVLANKGREHLSEENKILGRRNKSPRRTKNRSIGERMSSRGQRPNFRREGETDGGADSEAGSRPEIGGYYSQPNPREGRSPSQGAWNNELCEQPGQHVEHFVPLHDADSWQQRDLEASMHAVHNRQLSPPVDPIPALTPDNTEDINDSKESVHDLFARQQHGGVSFQQYQLPAQFNPRHNVVPKQMRHVAADTHPFYNSNPLSSIATLPPSSSMSIQPSTL